MFNRKQSRTDKTVAAVSTIVGAIGANKLNKKPKPSRKKRALAAGTIVAGAAIVGSALNKDQKGQP